MDLKIFGENLKKLRYKANLTQKDFGEKYFISAQAVSKWEMGKSLPDIATLNQICKDFDVSIDELLNAEELIDVENKLNRKLTKQIIVIICVLMCILFLIYVTFFKQDNFEIKYIGTTCNDFNLSGIVVYNEKTSHINLSGITYCGDQKDETIYKKIECTLYEKNNNVEVIISYININKKITLEEFLKEVHFNVSDYQKMCKDYTENNLFLEINATDDNNKITTYKIPLKLDTTCD